MHDLFSDKKPIKKKIRARFGWYERWESETMTIQTWYAATFIMLWSRSSWK